MFYLAIEDLREIFFDSGFNIMLRNVLCVWLLFLFGQNMTYGEKLTRQRISIEHNIKDVESCKIYYSSESSIEKSFFTIEYGDILSKSFSEEAMQDPFTFLCQNDNFQITGKLTIKPELSLYLLQDYANNIMVKGSDDYLKFRQNQEVILQNKFDELNKPDFDYTRKESFEEFPLTLQQQEEMLDIFHPKKQGVD